MSSVHPAREALPARSVLPAGLLRGTAGLLGLRLVHAGLTLALAVVLARLLGPEGYGVYAHVLALVTLLAVPARLGLPNLVVREVAAGLAGRQWGRVRALLRCAGGGVALASGALMLAAAGMLWLLGEGGGAYTATLALGLPLLPLLALGDLRGAALRGLGRVVQGQLPEHVLRPGLLLAMIAALALPGAALTPATAMGAHAAAAALAFAAGAWLLKRHLPPEVRSASPTGATGPWMRSALPLAFIAGMQVIVMQTDVLMLGILAASADVGVYRVAVQGSLLIAFGLEAAKIASAPHLAGLHARGEHRRQAASFRTAAALALSLGGVTALGLVLAGPWLIRQAFGTAYAAAYLPLVILCGGQLLRVLGGMAGELLNMSGREAVAARAVAAAALANLALNALLIPAFGLPGAAAATAASLALWTALAARGAHAHLRREAGT